MKSLSVPIRIPGPWRVLALLAVVQWLAALALALTVRHNGWLYYQGGDETYYYTGAWALGHGHLPTASVGYGWSLVLAPVSWFAGSSLLKALPAIVLFQTILLLPVALACVYGIAARIGGRLIGYLAAAAWVAAPYLAIPFFDQRYHDRYTEQFLPQALGLTGLADFPSMVALLVAAYFAFRALDGGGRAAAIASGLATGFALGIKPANGLYLAAPVLAFLLARRWRALAWSAVALIPTLVTLAVWKQRGLGHIPAFSLEQQRLAVGTAPLLGTFHIGKYVRLDWAHLHANFAVLREFFWPLRFVEWLPLAGFVAVARRSLPKAAFLGAWLALHVLIKGSYENSSVDGGSFFRFLMPAFPAFLLLAAAIPMLVPTFGVRLAEHSPAAGSSRSVRPRLVGAAVVIVGLLPLAVIGLVPPLSPGRAATFFSQGVNVPVADKFTLAATRSGKTVSLRWRPPSTGSTRVFYLVFRTDSATGISCDRSPGRVADCAVGMDMLENIRVPRFVDRPPKGGAWTYRVGLAANWRNDFDLGDVLLLSSPVTVRIPLQPVVHV